MNKLAYLVVLIVHSTIPFAIKLGGHAFSPIAGISLRMIIAFAIGWVVFGLFGIRLNFRKHSLVYFVASLGIFPNFVLIYMAVEYIPSGMVALLLGLQPFFNAILMRPILGESGLQPRKIFAIFLALAGLALILLEGNRVEMDNAIGVLLTLASGCLFSGCILWIKRLNKTLAVPPLEQTLGAMAFSLPGLLLSWWLIAGIEPIVFTPMALASLFYLVLAASLLGFAAYYYILNRMAIETVALIPMITPVVAILLGAVFLDEPITTNIITGTVLLLIALAIHQEIWQRSR